MWWTNESTLCHHADLARCWSASRTERHTLQIFDWIINVWLCGVVGCRNVAGFVYVTSVDIIR